MVLIEDTIWCDGCGVEILWAPLVVKGRHYCCQDCSAGYACRCGGDENWDDERRDRHAQNTYTQEISQL